MLPGNKKKQNRIGFVFLIPPANAVLAGKQVSYVIAGIGLNTLFFGFFFFALWRACE